jgi:hypothetical protein
VKAGTLYDGMSLDQLWTKTVPFGPDYWVNDDMLQMKRRRWTRTTSDGNPEASDTASGIR